MAQIDKDYFTGSISIPNTTRPEGSASINNSIEEYEREVLIKVLGYDLYTLFIDNPTDQRFIDLIQGKEFEFEFNGKIVKRKYLGFQNAEKRSLIAYYVYYFHQRNLATVTSSASETSPNHENANNASPYGKLMRAWNNYVDMAGFVTYNGRYNGEHFDTLNPGNSQHCNSEPSLFNFLLANKDVYPEWEFVPSGKINLFGI